MQGEVLVTGTPAPGMQEPLGEFTPQSQVQHAGAGSPEIQASAALILAKPANIHSEIVLPPVGEKVVNFPSPDKCYTNDLTYNSGSEIMHKFAHYLL